MEREYKVDDYDLNNSINYEFKRAFDLLKELGVDNFYEEYYFKTRYTSE